MQALALISLYAPMVIIIVAVVAVLFTFFWVFLPLPRCESLRDPARTECIDDVVPK